MKMQCAISTVSVHLKSLSLPTNAQCRLGRGRDGVTWTGVSGSPTSAPPRLPIGTSLGRCRARLGCKPGQTVGCCGPHISQNVEWTRVCRCTGALPRPPPRPHGTPHLSVARTVCYLCTIYQGVRSTV